MIWPAEIAVPPRPVLGLRDAPEGEEEGAMCLRNHGPTLATVCRSRLELRSDDGAGCYCGAVAAPCHSCLSSVPECPKGCYRYPEPD